MSNHDELFIRGNIEMTEKNYARRAEMRDVSSSYEENNIWRS